MSASTRRKVNKTSSKLPTGEIKLNGKVHKRKLSWSYVVWAQPPQCDQFAEKIFRI